jgi:hypothetical protein
LPRGVDAHVALDEAVGEGREHADLVGVNQESCPAGGGVVLSSARSRSIRMLIASFPPRFCIDDRSLRQQSHLPGPPRRPRLLPLVCLGQLTGNPFGARMRGYTQPEKLATAVS